MTHKTHKTLAELEHTSLQTLQPIPPEELAIAQAGGLLPLSLKRAHNNLKFWTRRLADADLRLQSALEDADASRICRCKVDCIYYTKGEHEARQHLTRIKRLVAEAT